MVISAVFGIARHDRKIAKGNIKVHDLEVAFPSDEWSRSITGSTSSKAGLFGVKIVHGGVG